MREIEFRAKRIDNGEWVYGDLLQPTKDGILDIYEISDHNSIMGDREEIDPEPIGQFTGLTDKNGKKIFEGDIVRYIPQKEYNLLAEDDEDLRNSDLWTYDTVVYGDEKDYPAFDLNNHEFECNALSLLLAEDWHLEVIGNIHDNPELLEEQENE